MKGLQLFICSAVLVTAYALTVETPIKKVEVARGNNATLRCNFNTNTFTNIGDFVVWKKSLARMMLSLGISMDLYSMARAMRTEYSLLVMSTAETSASPSEK